MSMDDVYERSVELARALEQFNSHVRRSITEVDRAHDVVNPLWNDEMRRDYDRRWLPLEEGMKDYGKHIGPDYVEFLTERLKHLNLYLHGHGS